MVLEHESALRVNIEPSIGCVAETELLILQPFLIENNQIFVNTFKHDFTGEQLASQSLFLSIKTPLLSNFTLVLVFLIWTVTQERLKIDIENTSCLWMILILLSNLKSKLFAICSLFPIHNIEATHRYECAFLVWVLFMMLFLRNSNIRFLCPQLLLCLSQCLFSLLDLIFLLFDYQFLIYNLLLILKHLLHFLLQILLIR